MVDAGKIKRISVGGKSYGVGGGGLEAVASDLGITGERFTELLDRYFYVPTLEAEPTEGTLTYTDTDGSECEFRVGQMCRVRDAGVYEGYRFWVLYDVTEAGKAVWVMYEIGGAKYEKVRIMLYSDKVHADAALLGTTVVVTDTTNGVEVLNVTWQGSELTCDVPEGAEYTVEVGNVVGYATPRMQRYTAVYGVRSVGMTYAYIQLYIDYVTLDQSITDPATMLSGDINGAAVQEIRRNSHRVLGKLGTDGKMYYCTLMDSDGTKYHDGTAAVLTGGEGDVFMKLPKFWWRVTEESENVFKIGLCSYYTSPGEDWKEWDGTEFIGVYKASDYKNISSVSGISNMYNIARDTIESYAAARGTGYCLTTWDAHCMMAMLFYCKYGHMDSQLKVGTGFTNYKLEAGITNTFGMTDTVGAGGNGDGYGINFWGLEHWWGLNQEYIYHTEGNNGELRIMQRDGSIRVLTGMPKMAKYITKCKLGSYFDLYPIEVGGTSTTSYCDTSEHSSGIGDVARGGLRDAIGGGVSHIRSLGSDSIFYIGCRLSFIGDFVEVEDVAEFKALPIIN